MTKRMSAKRTRKRVAALLISMFLMIFISTMVVIILDVEVTEMSITRNVIDLNKALYVADAGIQHSLGMLRTDRTWRTGFTSPGVQFSPGSGNYYVVTVADGVGGEVIVTSTSSVRGLTKTVRATISVAP